MREVNEVNPPFVSISWGELFDKITILQIKFEKITTQKSLENINQELTHLISIFDIKFKDNALAKDLKKDLERVNNKLWEIEDQIREKERKKTFDKEFIQLARSVYITNDERARIKKKINVTFESSVVEEKSYSEY